MYYYMILFDLKHAAPSRYQAFYKLMDQLGKRHIHQWSCHILCTDLELSVVEDALASFLDIGDRVTVLPVALAA